MNISKLNYVRLLYADYCPRIFYSDNYRMDIELAIAICNEELHDDFISFVEFSKKSDLSDEFISATLQHDIGGLIGSDKDFLPKVSGYSKNKN